MNLESLKASLIRDEAIRLKPYRDTVGKLTIGVGRNLDDVGITISEAMFLLESDIAKVTRELSLKFEWWLKLSDVRQQAIANMAFNLGVPRFSGFHKLIAALDAKDYVVAAAEMMDSEWAKQVGDRAKRLEAMMISG